MRKQAIRQKATVLSAFVLVFGLLLVVAEGNPIVAQAESASTISGFVLDWEVSEVADCTSSYLSPCADEVLGWQPEPGDAGMWTVTFDPNALPVDMGGGFWWYEVNPAFYPMEITLEPTPVEGDPCFDPETGVPCRRDLITASEVDWIGVAVSDDVPYGSGLPCIGCPPQLLDSVTFEYGQGTYEDAYNYGWWDIVDFTGVALDGIAIPGTIDVEEWSQANVTVLIGETGPYTHGVWLMGTILSLGSLEVSWTLDWLVDTVTTLNLDNGISNSLDAKLANAIKALDDVNENNDVAAINKLQAFINEVQAQAGNKIPQADADALMAAAQQIIDLLASG